VWAQYTPITGKSAEQLEGGQFSGNTYGQFLIRFRNDVGVKDQIVFTPSVSGPSRSYDIQSIDIVGERNEYLQILGLERRSP
jgi:hypothetical protein